MIDNYELKAMEKEYNDIVDQNILLTIWCLFFGLAGHFFEYIQFVDFIEKKLKYCKTTKSFY